MIPLHYECPSGWRREYYGYLMAASYAHKAATQYTCKDKSVEQIATREWCQYKWSSPLHS